MLRVTKVSDYCYHCFYNDVFIAVIDSGHNPLINKKYYDVRGTSGLIKFKQFHNIAGAKKYIKTSCDELIK